MYTQEYQGGVDMMIYMIGIGSDCLFEREGASSA